MILKKFLKVNYALSAKKSLMKNYSKELKCLVLLNLTTNKVCKHNKCSWLCNKSKRCALFARYAMWNSLTSKIW